MISSRFRRHPERNAGGKMSVFGPAIAEAGRMRAYAARRNPNAPDAAYLFLEIGERFGIRGDVAYCQAMLDTRTWTEEPEGPPGKPFANAVWGGQEGEWTVSELKTRIERQMQRLCAIAEEREGDLFCWEDLSGIWSVPGWRYGRDVTAIWRNMMEWNQDGEREDNMQEDNMQEEDMQGEIAAKGMKLMPAAKEQASADLAWLAARGGVPEPAPHPDRKVTWAELARVLRNWQSDRKETS